jgi:hypothetical protein
MKTLKTLSFALAFIFIQMNVFADGLKLKEEAYIDDIPFNTALIFDSVMKVSSMSNTIEMPEETYINDIPFSTEQVVDQYRSDSAMQVSFKLTDEKPIDDIPFDTRSIANRQCGFQPAQFKMASARQ